MTPKIQFAQRNYFPDSFLAVLNAWLIKFFGYAKDEPTPMPRAFDDVDIRLPTVVKKEKVARIKRDRSRTQLPPDMETFSALLEGLDDSFYSLQVPPISGSFLSKREVNSIKKLGIFIPTPMEIEFYKNPTIDKDTPRTAIASALMIPRKAEREHSLLKGNENMMCPRFTYCIKGAKLPESVEAIRGTPYQFGVCFEMQRDEAGKEMKPKMFWAWCWIVIQPDGSINIPHERRQVNSTVRHKRLVGGSHSSIIHSRAWCLPTLAIAETGRDQNDHETFMKCTFRQLLIWWQKRPEQWSVGVRRDGHRVVFGIDKRHTAGYFADRDTVVNVEGKPRKIIHFVREHERINGSTVKAHVRGLREFDWKGYHCVVTAPYLKGTILTAGIELDPVLLEDQDATQTYINTEEMAQMLAEREDATV